MLNFKSFGQGDPLIILHGLFGMLDNWQTVAKRLAEHYTVFIVDQRNHGRSPHFPEMDYGLMANDLKEFLESQWVYKAHIMGHSMGGKTAMQFALDHPEMTEKLIVVDMSPKAYPGGHEAIFDALLALDLAKVEGRGDALSFLEGRIEEEGVRLFLMKNLSRQKTGGYVWKMNLSAIYQHYADILAPIESELPFEGECLFLGGEHSNYIQPDDHPNIHALFPQAHIQTIPQAGHWIHADQPQALIQAVRAFLDQ